MDKRVVVFAPSPQLVVAIDMDGEVHLHAGGPGAGAGRSAAAMGVPVSVCASFGGEAGAAVQALMERELGVDIRAVSVLGANGVVVRDGARVVARQEPAALGAGELADLHGSTLVESLGAAVCVLADPPSPHVVPIDEYRRLAADVDDGAISLVAELSGSHLRAALDTGVTVVIADEEQLWRDGWIRTMSDGDVRDVVHRMLGDGAGAVLVRRAGGTTLAGINGHDWVMNGTVMTGGVAGALAKGLDVEAAMQPSPM
ncbi:MAG: hypothetical protein ACYDD4_09450 [Acidimicrobiales bacterium]